MRHLACLFVPGWVAATCILNATPLSLAHDLEGPGLAVAQAGVGLTGLKTETRRIVVNVPAPVELALLYWAGRDHPCSPDPETVCGIPEEPYRDQELLFDGVALTGTVIGTELQPDTSRGPVLNIGYVADVTEEVGARGTGKLSFAVADGDPGSNLAELQGAGLLVVTSDPGEPAARVIVFQGLDFVYGEDRMPGPGRIAEAITFNHGAARTLRRGALVVFMGGGEGGKAPDRIDVSPVNARIFNKIDGSSGASWDADRFTVQVPVGNLSTTVRLVSEPWGKNPDSMLWVMAALWLPLPVPSGCTPAFWHRDRTEQWKYPGLPPSQKMRFIFPTMAAYGDVAETTLRAAFVFPDEPGLLGAVRMLAREGGAAMLNSAHFRIEYPMTRTQVLTHVEEVLRSGDEAAMRGLAEQLRAWNAAACPLR